jgi:two-component system sensor histidine kinase RpfC
MTKLYRFVSIDRPYIPIIALTADATPEAKVRCIEAGMDDCLTKPVEPNELLQLLNTVAGRAPQKQKPEDAQKSDDAEPQPAVAADEQLMLPETREEPTIDLDTLTYLQKLGGKDFVSDILSQYVSDAARMLGELSDAVSQENLPKFQDQVHALRSCSANVGAKAIYNLCLSWREIDAYDLAVRGEDHMRLLEAEFAKAKSALIHYEEG